MPNKFHKSVQERQSAQATQSARAVAPTKEWEDPPPAQPDPAEKAAAPSPAQPNPVKRAADPPAEKPAKPAVDIEAYLRPSSVRIAKNKTFYLDEEVVSAIKAAAQSRRVTESKLANDILRTVLLGER